MKDSAIKYLNNWQRAAADVDQTFLLTTFCKKECEPQKSIRCRGVFWVEFRTVGFKGTGPPSLFRISLTAEENKHVDR